MLSDHTIQALDSTTVRQLHSGQVIIDIESIVKELIENALDANAQNIDVKLINNGLSLVQVKDDGYGIDENSRSSMCHRHHTSKITSMDDLENLKTFGFRGEALNSICALSKTFQIITKTKQDSLAMQYELDHSGKQISKKPIGSISHSGTIISAYEPFFTIPVRRQMAQKAFSFKRIQDMMTKYCLVYPWVRFALTSTTDSVGLGSARAVNNKWLQPATSGIMKAIATAYGSQLCDMLEHHRVKANQSQLSMECVLAKPDADPAAIYRGERIHVYVNKRPVNYAKCDLKELISMARKGFGRDPSPRKTPFIFISIELKGDQLDVNLEPSKTAVMLHHKQDVIDLFQNLVHQIYDSPIQVLFGRQMDPMIDHQRLDQDSPQPLDMPENSSNYQKYANIRESMLNDDNDSSLDNTNTRLVPRQDLQGPALGEVNNELSPSNNSLKENSTNVDIDIPLDYHHDQHEQEENLAGEEDEQDQLLDEDNDDGMKGGSDAWKFSMLSQDTVSSSSSSSSIRCESEQDQLIPSEAGDDDLILPSHDREPHVPTLSEWLKTSQQQQQQQPPQALPVINSTSSSLSLPIFANPAETAASSAPNLTDTSRRSSHQPSPETTPSSPTAVPASRNFNTPQKNLRSFNSPLITTPRPPVQRREDNMVPTISSSPLTTTVIRPPTAASTRCRIHSPTPERFVENNHSLDERLLTILSEESRWQIDPDPLDEQVDTTCTPMTVCHSQQRQPSVSLPEKRHKNTSLSPPSRTHDNRDLYDMFRMQSSLSPPETTSILASPTCLTAAEKGKRVVRDHSLAQNTPSQPIMISQPATITSATATATDTTLSVPAARNSIHNIPRKRKRNTLFSDRCKKSTLFDTLNLAMSVQCNGSFIRINYPSQRRRLLRFHRIRLDCYPLEQGIKNNIIVRQFPLSNQDMNRLSLVAYAKQQGGINVNEVGVMVKDRMEIASTITWLLKHHELGYDKQLRTPITFELSQEDPYFHIIKSLQGHDTRLVRNDEEDEEQSLKYTVVTDPRIVANGFDCRWRMSDSNTMLLQLIAIHRLDGGKTQEYGAADFRELLMIIQQRQKERSDDDDIDLSMYRPNRVQEYFRYLLKHSNIPHLGKSSIQHDDSLLTWKELEQENGEVYTVGVNDILQEQSSAVCCALYRPV